jgi:hypothetical protein
VRSTTAAGPVSRALRVPGQSGDVERDVRDLGQRQQLTGPLPRSDQGAGEDHRSERVAVALRLARRDEATQHSLTIDSGWSEGRADAMTFVRRYL